MYFDRLKDIQTHAKKELFETCLAAEENARIRPNESVINARKALEIFVASVLADNGITIPSNRYEKQRQGLSNLYEQIRKCRNEKYIDQKNFIQNDEKIREQNEIVHITYKDPGNQEKY